MHCGSHFTSLVNALWLTFYFTSKCIVAHLLLHQDLQREYSLFPVKRFVHAIDEEGERQMKKIAHRARGGGGDRCLFGCGRRIAGRTHLKEHMLSHVFLIACHCGKRFSSPQQVRRHQRQRCMVSKEKNHILGMQYHPHS